jgi:hypothetical protein
MSLAAIRWHDLHVFHAEAPQVLRHPFGGATNIVIELGIGGNGWNFQHLDQLIQEAFTVLSGIIECSLKVSHDSSLVHSLV